MKIRHPLVALMLVNLVGLAGLPPPGVQATGSLPELSGTGNRAAMQAVVVPKITKARIEKKDLIVEGDNFAGAKLLVNGTKALKARNDEATPDTKLIVKKGRNLLPVDEIIILQVKNSDERTSEAFGFFTGLTFTYHNTRNGASHPLAVGQIFLVNFDDPGFSPWYIVDYGNYGPSGGAIEPVTFNVPLMPKAQGVFLAKQPGGAYIHLRGEAFGQPPFLWLVNLDVK